MCGALNEYNTKITEDYVTCYKKKVLIHCFAHRFSVPPVEDHVTCANSESGLLGPTTFIAWEKS